MRDLGWFVVWCAVAAACSGDGKKGGGGDDAGNGGECTVGGPLSVSYDFACSVEPANGCNVPAQSAAYDDDEGRNGGGCHWPGADGCYALTGLGAEGQGAVSFQLCDYTGPGTYVADPTSTSTMGFSLPNAQCNSGPAGDMQPDTSEGSCTIEVSSDCADESTDPARHHVRGTFSCSLVHIGSTCTIDGSFDLAKCE